MKSMNQFKMTQHSEHWFAELNVDIKSDDDLIRFVAPPDVMQSNFNDTKHVDQINVTLGV